MYLVLDDLQEKEFKNAHNIEYNHEFGDTHAQTAAVKVFMRLLQVRNKLLELPSSTSTSAVGAALDTASPASQRSNREILLY